MGWSAAATLLGDSPPGNEVVSLPGYTAHRPVGRAVKIAGVQSGDLVFCELDVILLSHGKHSFLDHRIWIIGRLPVYAPRSLTSRAAVMEYSDRRQMRSKELRIRSRFTSSGKARVR